MPENGKHMPENGHLDARNGQQGPLLFILLFCSYSKLESIEVVIVR